MWCDYNLGLAQLLQQPGWSMSFGKIEYEGQLQEGIIIDAPTKRYAGILLAVASDSLGQSAQRFNFDATFIRWPSCKKVYRIPLPKNLLAMTQSDPIITLPGLEISDLFLTPALLPWIAHFLENPEIKGGIIRLRDEKQLVLSSAIAPVLSGGTVKSATRRVRSNFWYLPDLENMRQVTRDAGSSFEFSYRCHGSDEHVNDWFSTHNRYNLIEDASGEVYQKFEILNTQPILAP